jgi:hypothetical protein
MREFQDRKKPKSVMKSKIMMILILVLLIVITRGTITMYTKERDSREELEIALKEKEALMARFNDVKERVDSIQGQIGIETEIRKKFDVVKEGEGVIVIVDKELPAEVEEESRGIVQKFFDSVKGIFIRE